MKLLSKCLSAAAAVMFVGSLEAKVIVVNTVDNTDTSSGKTSLATAFRVLASGDTINFNLPGPGPFYIATPSDGYPYLTGLTNITINGYSQPGSSPNTHTILSSNNAVISVYLDSRNGGLTDVSGHNGYDQEGAILPILGWTNTVISGLGFLGNNPPADGSAPIQLYAIAMGGEAPTENTHIFGCRFGLDADNTTVFQLRKNIVSYGAKVTGFCDIGVAPGSKNPRAEFNVQVGGYITMDLGGTANSVYHIAGNFLNVFPDGLHDFNIDGNSYAGVDHIVEAIFEFGSPGPGSVFGTDGDGVNDAEERNVIGGITQANDGNVWECYGNGPDHMRMAGNYFGVGVDGVTRFSNGGPSMEWLNIYKRNASTLLLGSDFDGVSDDLEANLFYWNNPFTDLYGNPPVVNPGPNADQWAFIVGPNGTRGASTWTGLISMRGNVLVDNLLAPFMYAGNDSAQFVFYESPFMNTTNFAKFPDLIPTLSPSSSASEIMGTCPTPNYSGSFTNLFIDLYVLDGEGWNNGMAFSLPDLTIPGVSTNGFPAGKTFLGTFVDNGPLDRDPAVGRFDFDAAALNLVAGTQVTITSNYSMDRAGTHNGRTHTSNFSNPVALLPAFKVASATRNGSSVTLTWSGGTAPFSLRRKTSLNGAWTTVQAGITAQSTTYNDSAATAFYQVVGN